MMCVKLFWSKNANTRKPEPTSSKWAGNLYWKENGSPPLGLKVDTETEVDIMDKDDPYLSFWCVQ